MYVYNVTTYSQQRKGFQKEKLGYPYQLFYHPLMFLQDYTYDWNEKRVTLVFQLAGIIRDFMEN
jgi:hypothetical protein